VPDQNKHPILIDLKKVGYTSFSGAGVANILMAGPCPALKFVGTHPGGSPSKNVWARQRMPLVDGVAIGGDHPKAVGIEANGITEMTLTLVHVRETQCGVHLVGKNREVIISNCHFFENPGIGIYYDNVALHQSNIVGCHISDNLLGGIVVRAGDVRNIHVTGCDLEDNMRPDAPPTANILIDCTDSRHGIGGIAVTGCTLQHNNHSPGSANIRILGRSKPGRGLDIVRGGNITITGNILSDVKVNVHLKGCRGVAMTGNTMWKGYEHNLLIEDCRNIVVGPNIFDHNPHYNYGNSLEANNSLVVRNSADCTLSGLHINTARRDPAGLLIENCRRMNITNCTILDTDNVGVMLKNVTDSRVPDCLIRDDRPEPNSTPLKVVGGKDNMIINNLFSSAPQIEKGTGHVEGNIHP